MKTILRTIFVWSFALAFAGVHAYACICELKPPPCYEFGKSDTVFIGKVTEIDGSQPPYSKIVLKVEKGFKGVASETMITQPVGTSCDFETFRLDRRYLIYGSLDRDDKSLFGTGYCSRSTELGNYSEDLDFLNNNTDPSNRYLVWGTLHREAGEKLNGIRAQVIDSKQRIVGTSDSSGNIRLQVNAPGTYSVRVFPPKGTMLHHDSLMGSEIYKGSHFAKLKDFNFDEREPFVDYQVTVAESSCGWFRLSLEKYRDTSQ